MVQDSKFESTLPATLRAPCARVPRRRGGVPGAGGVDEMPWHDTCIKWRRLRSVALVQ